MSEFDKFVDRYEDILSDAVKQSGYASSFFVEGKIRELHRFLKSLGRDADALNILDFGCGIGKAEPIIRSYFKNAFIYAVDVSEDSIAAARTRNKDMDRCVYATFDGHRLPFEHSFDLVYIAGTLHHIPREQHVPLLYMLGASLRERGMIFIFEHNPYNPLTVKAVRSCELDEHAVLLKPGYLDRVLNESGFTWRKLRFILFFPSFLRLLLPLERYLGWLPLGAQYYYIASKQRKRSGLK